MERRIFDVYIYILLTQIWNFDWIGIFAADIPREQIWIQSYHLKGIAIEFREVFHSPFVLTLTKQMVCIKNLDRFHFGHLLIINVNNNNSIGEEELINNIEQHIDRRYIRIRYIKTNNIIPLQDQNQGYIRRGPMLLRTLYLLRVGQLGLQWEQGSISIRGIGLLHRLHRCCWQ